VSANQSTSGGVGKRFVVPEEGTVGSKEGSVTPKEDTKGIDETGNQGAEPIVLWHALPQTGQGRSLTLPLVGSTMLLITMLIFLHIMRHKEALR